MTLLGETLGNLCLVFFILGPVLVPCDDFALYYFVGINLSHQYGSVEARESFQ